MHPVPSTDGVLHIVSSEQVKPPFPPHVLVLTQPSGRKTYSMSPRYLSDHSARSPFRELLSWSLLRLYRNWGHGRHAACYSVGLLLLLACLALV